MLNRFFVKVFPWLGIFAFVSMLGGYLYAKSPTAGGAKPLEAAAPQPPVDGEESWFVVSYQNKRIGYTHSLRRPLAEGRSESHDEVHLKMTLMNQQRNVVTKTTMQLGAGGEVESFVFTMESAGINIRVDGRQTAGKLHLTMYSAGTTQAVEYPLQEPILMSGNLARQVAQKGMKTGQTYSRSFFDPSVMKPSVMKISVGEQDTVKVGARTIDVFKVTQTYNGLETVSWIDRDGVVYKEESPNGFSSFRTTREDATKPGDGPAIDLIEATSILIEGELIEPRKTSRLVLELSGVDLKGFDLDGDGQRLEGTRLTIDRNAKTGADIDEANYTRAEPLLQVDDPEVKRAVREATGGLTEANEASKRILKWVYGNLAKTSTVSLPSAVEVLRTRQGDCNEHAILYTAMTRAAGIPSRVASGLVALGDRFYYHAWSEVYLDGRWLAVDPVFGQYPADATHLRFVVGGLERQAELMRVIGKLKIKVIGSVLY